MTDKRIKEPCPFCGNAAENIQIKHYTDGLNKIMCPKCNVTFEGFYSKQEVIDKWNARYRRYKQNNFLTEREIEIVMNALAGNPTLTTSKFADKIEQILRKYKEEDDE